MTVSTNVDATHVSPTIRAVSTTLVPRTRHHFNSIQVPPTITDVRELLVIELCSNYYRTMTLNSSNIRTVFELSDSSNIVELPIGLFIELFHKILFFFELYSNYLSKNQTIQTVELPIELFK